MRYKKQLRVTFRKLRDDMLLVKGDTVFQVNDLSVFIWQNCDGVRTVGDLVDLILGKYEIDRETAVADCTAFLQEAINSGLLVAVEG